MVTAHDGQCTSMVNIYVALYSVDSLNLFYAGCGATAAAGIGASCTDLAISFQSLLFAVSFIV